MKFRCRYISFILLSSFAFSEMAYAAFITSKHREEYTRLNFNWESQVEYELSQKGNIVTLKFKRSHPLTKAQLDTQLKKSPIVVHSISQGQDFLELSFELKKPARALTLNKGGLVLLDFVYDDVSEEDETSADKKESRPVQEITKKDKPAEEVKKSDSKQDNSSEKTSEELTTLNQKPEFTAAASEPALDDAVQILIDETVEGLRLTFDFTKPSFAGAFIEAGDLWLYFDQPVKFSWNEMVMNGSQFITDLVTYKSNSLSAVKIDLATEPEKSSFYRKGNQWVFETSDLQGITPNYVIPRTSEKVVTMTDTTFGEPILAQMPNSDISRYFIPSSGSSVRVAKKYRYLDFSVRPTILGAIIDPLSEGLSVSKQDKDIVVNKESGLALAAQGDYTLKRQRYQPPSLVNVAEWTSDAKDTAQNKRDYQWDIINTPKQQRTPKRLELVRHYLLTGRDFEALGLLSAALLYDPALEKSPYYHSLKGLSEFACNYFEDARNSFDHPVLAGDPEMRMWFELSKASIDPKDVNLELISSGLSYLDKYPQFFRNSALLYASDVAMTQKKDDSVFLSRVHREELTSRQQEHYDFLKVRNQVDAFKGGEAMVALEKYSKTMRSEFGLKANLLLIQLKVEGKTLGPQDEIKALEKLRFRWSGDPTEYDLWMHLSERYSAINDYENSLKFLRKGIRHFPQLAKRHNLQDKGEKLFLSAISDKGSDLFLLLGLYQEYDLFIPVDERRFKIQEQLIDLLVKADLVDEAMMMLAQAVKDPSLDDEQRIRMRTRYGLLALLDDQPEKALMLLDYQEGESVPSDLVEQRRYLVAQINLMKGKYDVVHEMLKDDYTQAAYELLGQAFINQKQWGQLVDYTQEYLSRQSPEGGKVDAGAVVRLATGYSLLQKENELKKLRAKYANSITESPYKEAFELITAEDPTDFSTKGLNKELLESQQLTKFLETYRQKVKDQGLSAM